MTHNSTQFESFIKVFKRFLFIVFLAFSVVISFLLPENIPTHFNANGEVDKIANKVNFIFLPIVGIVIYFLIYFIKNYLIVLQKGKVDYKENELSKNLVLFSLLQISVILVFIIIMVSTYLISKNNILSMGKWFLPFTIIILCFPSFFYFIDNYKDKS